MAAPEAPAESPLKPREDGGLSRAADPDPHRPLGRARLAHPRGLPPPRRLRHGAGDLRRAPRRRHRARQGVRPARPWRRGLPDRHEVGLRPAERPASRTTSWSTPTSPSRVPARTSRSCSPTRTRSSRAASTPSYAIRAQLRVHLHPRRGAARRSAASPPRCARPTTPASSARTSSARASTSTSSCTPARAPTSAARRRRCSTRSRVVAASRASSRRSPRSPASTAARRSSTTSRRSRTSRRSCATAPSGSSSSAPRSRPGFKLFAVSGHVERPGIYEAPLGTTMRELLEYAGGVREGHELKFWIPGGSSASRCSCPSTSTPR